MTQLDQSISRCIKAMKDSEYYTDNECKLAFGGILDLIVENPSAIVNCRNEELLSLIMSTIVTSGYAEKNTNTQGYKTMNLAFAIGFYLFMHQLETGNFLDRDWAAFIVLLHDARETFADFILSNAPEAQVSPYDIFGINSLHNMDAKKWDIAKGIELNMMLVCKNKGFMSAELMPWYDELISEKDKLLSSDPFRRRAIPLYKEFADNFVNNRLSFLEID